jgi:hypothetical protein
MSDTELLPKPKREPELVRATMATTTSTASSSRSVWIVSVRCHILRGQGAASTSRLARKPRLFRAQYILRLVLAPDCRRSDRASLAWRPPGSVGTTR